MTDAQPTRWLTVQEYAKLKRVSERTVRQWLKDGRLKDNAEQIASPKGRWRIRYREKVAS